MMMIDRCNESCSTPHLTYMSSIAALCTQSQMSKHVMIALLNSETISEILWIYWIDDHLSSDLCLLCSSNSENNMIVGWLVWVSIMHEYIIETSTRNPTHNIQILHNVCSLSLPHRFQQHGDRGSPWSMVHHRVQAESAAACAMIFPPPKLNLPPSAAVGGTCGGCSTEKSFRGGACPPPSWTRRQRRMCRTGVGGRGRRQGSAASVAGLCSLPGTCV